jgi:hypothetical protein
MIIASENGESHPQKTTIGVGDDVSRSEAYYFVIHRTSWSVCWKEISLRLISVG